MKKIFLFLFLMFPCVIFSSTEWSPLLYLYINDNKQYMFYSIYYDESKKSMSICIDHYLTGVTQGTIPPSTVTRSYILNESSNPKLFTSIKEVLANCLHAVQESSPGGTAATSRGNSAYIYFFLMYDNALDPSNTDTLKRIRGIKVQAFRGP